MARTQAQTAARGDLYEDITARICDLLEAGTVPWRKPWRGGGAPRNFATGRPYRGINVLLLAFAPFGSSRWLTFNQAKALGGFVRKGERAVPIVFWKVFEQTDTDAVTGEEKAQRFPIARLYHVFNS